MRLGFFGFGGEGRRGHGKGFMRQWRQRQRGGLAGRAGSVQALTDIFDLNFAALGTACRVVGVSGHPAIRQRLIDLGLCPGRVVVVMRNAPLNDPIEIKVGDSYVAVRRREAAQVEVEYV